MIDVAELERRLRYVAPDARRVWMHEQVRSELVTAGSFLAELLPDSREKSLAITALEEVGFWANAAIARNVPDEQEDD